jgi:hypothetical protein
MPRVQALSGESTSNSQRSVPPAVLFVSTRSLDGHQERIMRSLET